MHEINSDCASASSSTASMAPVHPTTLTKEARLKKATPFLTLRNRYTGRWWACPAAGNGIEIEEFGVLFEHGSHHHVHIVAGGLGHCIQRGKGTSHVLLLLVRPSALPGHPESLISKR